MSGRRIAVVDHNDSHRWNLVHLVAGVAEVMPDVLSHTEVSLRDLATYTHLVLSPGPGDPRSADDFALDHEVFELPTAILGVCLGMQAMVWAHGGSVEVAEPSHGDLADVQRLGHDTFEGISSPFEAVRCHSLAASSLPDELVETAWCLDGGRRVTMAAAHRAKPIWGVQFHPESVLTEHGARLIANFVSLA